MGQRDLLTRRIENVRGQFSVTAPAYNSRRALILVGVASLMRAIHTLDGGTLAPDSGQNILTSPPETPFAGGWPPKT